MPKTYLLDYTTFYGLRECSVSNSVFDFGDIRLLFILTIFNRDNRIVEKWFYI
jgi:hypothetical protein